MDEQKAVESGIVLIRCGEGIQERTDVLPETVRAIVQIDSEVPLRSRGLVPDCRLIFNLDHYIPQDIMLYSQAEAYVLAHKKFGPLYSKLKERIFAADSRMSSDWNTIKEQPVDAHGAGAIWIQGCLKFFVALIGRPYEPTRRDKVLTVVRKPETRAGAHKGEIWVSMMTDLLFTLGELNPDELGLVGGVFGGTGPSGMAVLGEVLSGPGIKFNIVKVGLVAMPDSFMVNHHTPSDVANRLRAVIKVLSPMAVYSGLGWEGVFWHFLGDNLRTIGERFSNVKDKELAYGAAPVISIAGVPWRSDFHARWMVGLTATNRISNEEAEARINTAVANGMVNLEVVPYLNTLGVRVRVLNPNRMLIGNWENLLPALAAARAGIGTMTLPVVVEEKVGWSKKKVTKRLFVESVPEMDVLLQKANVTSMDGLGDAVAYWALTSIERAMLDRVRQESLKSGFAHIEHNFIQTAREILADMIFPTKDIVFPPQNAVLEHPAKALFVWGQVNKGPDNLADDLCGLFAKVDRSEEEAARLAEAERERIAMMTNRVDEMLAHFDPL